MHKGAITWQRKDKKIHRRQLWQVNEHTGECVSYDGSNTIRKEKSASWERSQKDPIKEFTTLGDEPEHRERQSAWGSTEADKQREYQDRLQTIQNDRRVFWNKERYLARTGQPSQGRFVAMTRAELRDEIWGKTGRQEGHSDKLKEFVTGRTGERTENARQRRNRKRWEERQAELGVRHRHPLRGAVSDNEINELAQGKKGTRRIGGEAPGRLETGEFPRPSVGEAILRTTRGQRKPWIGFSEDESDGEHHERRERTQSLVDIEAEESGSGEYEDSDERDTEGTVGSLNDFIDDTEDAADPHMHRQVMEEARRVGGRMGKLSPQERGLLERRAGRAAQRERTVDMSLDPSRHGRRTAPRATLASQRRERLAGEDGPDSIKFGKAWTREGSK